MPCNTCHVTVIRTNINGHAQFTSFNEENRIKSYKYINHLPIAYRIRILGDEGKTSLEVSM